MKTFIVEIARDATVRYQAKVQAKDLAEVQSYMRNHGYIGPIISEWEQVAVNEFDDVEQFIVTNEKGKTLYEKDRT